MNPMFGAEYDSVCIPVIFACSWDFHWIADRLAQAAFQTMYEMGRGLLIKMKRKPRRGSGASGRLGPFPTRGHVVPNDKSERAVVNAIIRERLVD